MKYFLSKFLERECVLSVRKKKKKQEKEQSTMYFSEAVDYLKSLWYEKKKDFSIRIWWKLTCILLAFLEAPAVVRRKPCAFLLYWIGCNLYLEDLQCLNAASISLGLGERGLMFSQTGRLSLAERKKEKPNTLRKGWWRLLSQCLSPHVTGFDSVAFRNSQAISQSEKRLRSLFAYFWKWNVQSGV